jgi:hypothetical protein
MDCPNEAICLAPRALPDSDISPLIVGGTLEFGCVSHRLRRGAGLEQQISRASLG